MADLDEFDLFLQTWKPSERLLHSTLSQYINDPLSTKRLFSDSTSGALVERTQFANGKKVMEPDELEARAFSFFVEKQDEWAAHFEDYVLTKGVSQRKFEIFVQSFVKEWIDGKARRQNSPQMQAIKMSIQNLDHCLYPAQAGKWVINAVDDGVCPLFTVEEMAIIFEANDGLIEALLPQYVDHLGAEGPGCLGDLYVRRGVRMPQIEELRRELNYLSSYSLAIGPVEQFAQTWPLAAKQDGIPSIFSAPISAIQHRVVAFAPFIKGMDLDQLELVAAPPIKRTPLQNDKQYAGIYEFSFQ